MFDAHGFKHLPSIQIEFIGVDRRPAAAGAEGEGAALALVRQAGPCEEFRPRPTCRRSAVFDGRWCRSWIVAVGKSWGILFPHVSTEMRLSLNRSCF